MEKTHLQKMIELWEGIAKLHHEAMFVHDDPDDHGVFADDYREQSWMMARATAVVVALRQYQAKLEG